MNDPFARLPVVPNFTVTSTDVAHGQALPPAQMSGIFAVPGGKDLSPQLSWSGAPAETRSSDGPAPLSARPMHRRRASLRYPAPHR